jgi:hypothetical protein
MSTQEAPKVKRTYDEWREESTPEQYRILRERER